MDSATQWKEMFDRWPRKMARSGVVVTSFGEQIPFNDFLLGASMLVLQRKIPDNIGSRQIVLPYANIDALKITEVVKLSSFSEMGFAGKETASKG